MLSDSFKIGILVPHILPFRSWHMTFSPCKQEIVHGAAWYSRSIWLKVIPKYEKQTKWLPEISASIHCKTENFLISMLTMKIVKISEWNPADKFH